MGGLGNKEIMAKNIKRLMELKGKDRNDICRDLGFKYTTFTDWINAKTYPRIDKIEMMEETSGGEYSMDGYNRRGGAGREGYSREGYANDREDYDYGNSYRRGRNQRTGRYMHRSNYSRLSGDDDDMEEYRNSKREYSTNRDAASKERMLDALEDYMSGMTGMLKQLFKDSDCVEEREIIQRYAREIANM